MNLTSWPWSNLCIENASKRGGYCPLTDLLMLVCAVLAALAAGVLAAYGVCLGMFGLFRMHARQVAVKQVVPAPSSASILEG